MISWGQSMQNFVESYQLLLIPANLKRFSTKFLTFFVYTTKYGPLKTIIAASIWTASRTFFILMSSYPTQRHYIPRVDELI